MELCGPPPEGDLPDLPEFAQVVARITGDEELAERLADADNGLYVINAPTGGCQAHLVGASGGRSASWQRLPPP